MSNGRLATALLPTRVPPEIGPILGYIAPERFFADYYDRGMLRLNHATQQQLKQHQSTWPAEVPREPTKPGASLWALEHDLERDLTGMHADGKLVAGTSAVTAHGGSYNPVASDIASPASAHEFLKRKLQANVSLVLKYELVSAHHRPLKWISDALFNLTGIPASIHLYASAAGSRVLKPHTDPYDVLVHQLSGTKQWRACVPQNEVASTGYNTGVDLTDAQRCLLQELARDSIQGCTQYTIDDTHSMLCEDFTMAPGDFLYMPKGVVHYALTAYDAAAYHLTIGLHRDNMQWRDVVRYLIDVNEGEDAEVHTSRTGAAAVDIRALYAELMEIYSETTEGVHLQETVPGWLLACRRPWTLDANRSAAARERARDGNASCNELNDELKRLFGIHLDRFGSWLAGQVHEGPRKLVLKLAEARKEVGEHPDLKNVETLFWWHGGLRFLGRLRRDEAQLAAALNQVAQITDYHDTTRPRWPRRRKGGSREVRAFGEPPQGRPNLCDELSGWETECIGSNHDTCEAYVANWTTCVAFCESQGAWCEAGFDDVRRSCLRARSSSSASSACMAHRHTQICRCRRDCADLGPWVCNEEGCPAQLITCEHLSEACNALFSQIWRKPPAGMGPISVRQVCPMACSACVCPATDLTPVRPER